MLINVQVLQPWVCDSLTNDTPSFTMLRKEFSTEKNRGINFKPSVRDDLDVLYISGSSETWPPPPPHSRKRDATFSEQRGWGKGVSIYCRVAMAPTPALTHTDSTVIEQEDREMFEEGLEYFNSNYSGNYIPVGVDFKGQQKVERTCSVCVCQGLCTL